MAYTDTQRLDLYRQAGFLHGLAKIVTAYNSTDETKIDMGWLIDLLDEAAEQCEQEAES